MKRRIINLTAISAMAIVLGSACNKKDAADAAVQAGSPAQCPNMNIKVGSSENYAMDSAAGLSKSLTVYFDKDPAQPDRSYYSLYWNSVEFTQFNENKDGVQQPNGAHLKSNCLGGKFVVSGTDKDGNPVALYVSTKANEKGEKGLTVDDQQNNGLQFHYTEAAAAVTAFQTIRNIFAKPLGKTLTTTGLPKKEDLKAAQGSTPPPGAQPPAPGAKPAPSASPSPAAPAPSASPAPTQAPGAR